ncbi:MEDS domain-containing protein [Aquibacillus albus]|uniref:MEDS domain-containing protein n=1 Tax=Aquibacillus albus TaxID=1168171 RepID=A0ABS2N342_9BACI|nr:MEDS domain-containing protein [Aquibacillus albus]MBM7572557.1 hypothetical protein [Aquibacillus albus]
MEKQIELNNYLRVRNTSHILYLFEEKKDYMNNLIAYVKAGIERKHHLLIVENSTMLESIKEETKKIFSIDEQNHIHYFDNHTFYCYYGDFNIHNIVQHFGDIINSFSEKNITVRTWAHVEFDKNKSISKKIQEFEKIANCSVNDLGLMSVCAYNSNDLSAFLHTSLMKSHEYLMTDKEFFRSPLYQGIHSEF